MASDHVITLIDKRPLDFSQLSTGSTQVLMLSEHIDVSDFMWGTLVVRIHAASLAGGTLSFDIYGDGVTDEEPNLSFATAAPLFPSTPLQGGPGNLIRYSGPTPGDHLQLRAVAAKNSSSPLSATVSIDLVLRETGFSPSDISSCVLWLDMLEPGSYTVTPGAPNTVTAIKNLISGVMWRESANPPQFEPSGLNGRPCMKGDGASSRIISTDPAPVAAFLGNDRAQTVIVVTQPMSAAPVHYMSTFGAGNSGVLGNSTPYVGRQNSTGRLRFERNNDVGGAAAGTRVAVTSLVPQVVTHITAGTTASIYVNNEATPDPNGSGFSVGQITPDRCGLLMWPDSGPGGFSEDRLAAVLLFNTALDSETQHNAVAWLMARWGIS